MPLLGVGNDRAGCHGWSSEPRCDYHSYHTDAGCPTRLGRQSVACYGEPSLSSTSPATEPQVPGPATTQEGLNLLLDTPDFLTVHNDVSWPQPQPSPLSTDATSPRSNAPTSSSPASSSCEKGSSEKCTPQSTTSSPVSNVSQLSCDICREPFDDVDTLCAHLTSDHAISKPFHCGRATCETHNELRSLKRHLKNIHLRAVYICRCGHAGRKDKHCDHLRRNNCNGRGPYRCSCGYAVNSLHLHELHIDKCGRRKKGRPKKHTVQSG